MVASAATVAADGAKEFGHNNIILPELVRPLLALDEPEKLGCKHHWVLCDVTKLFIPLA